MIRKPLSIAMMLALTPVCSLAFSPFAQAVNAETLVKQSQTANGFLNLYFEPSSGELYVEANKLNQPFLLITSLPHGVGSNDIGLDRGQLGNTRMVQFEQHGPYIILKQLNTQYRASTSNLAEKAAVTQAFAESILWRGKLVEGTQKLVPINSLVVNDLHGVSDVLAATEQGSYQLDSTRSVVLPKGIKSFEKNADVDVNLTFTASKSGPQVAQVTPDGKFVSVRMRYSFVQLPEAGFEARDYHPMSGYLSDQYMDYSTPVNESVTKRHLLRHRLEKVTPGNAPSEVIRPITYYLDPGAPEPIRTALLEGAKWWETAFNEAGFLNGFKVEMLPEDADPQDVRYNMIQWVHRATRGWSYGAAITDPRTGEIIKGHVTLGSLRVRQDHLIAKGLTAGWADRKAADDASMALSLARIRQLSAHEIGHTLGLDHNFAASTNDRASVMDYPHPLVTLQGEQIDISSPYKEGIGDWDKYTIAFGYGQAANADALIKQASDKGYRYIGEADSRTSDASHAYASLWDNGSEPVAELLRLEKVRRKAITDFNASALLKQEPFGELQDAFVPIYLLTRYQLSAAAKFVGGVDYSYQQLGNGSVWQTIEPKRQASALEAMLASLAVESLSVPKNVLQSLVPKAGNYQKTRESFATNTGVSSDPVAMAEVLSRHIVSELLTPERLNRVDHAHMMNEDQFSVTGLVDQLLAQTVHTELPTAQALAVQMRVNTVVIDGLLAAFHNDKTNGEVKAQLAARLTFTMKLLARRSMRSSEIQAAHFDWLNRGIEQGLKEPTFKLITKPLAMPPGSPI